MDFNHAIRDSVQENPVVRHGNDCLIRFPQEFFEPFDRSNVEMICRLIQQQQFRIRQKQLCKREPVFLSAGKIAAGPFECVL